LTQADMKIVFKKNTTFTTKRHTCVYLCLMSLKDVNECH